MRVITILLFFVLFISTLKSQQVPEIVDSIVVYDNDIGYKVMKFGIDPTASDTVDWHLGEEDLPPFPPLGVFEVRYLMPKNNFSGIESSYWDFRQGSSPYTGVQEYRIRLQQGELGDTVKIGWNFAPSISARLQDIFTGNLVDISMTGQGTFIVPDPTVYEKFKFTITYSNATDVEDNTQMINDYELLQNYPNPFNPSTNITFRLNQGSDVVIKVFNVLGKETAVITNQFYSAGTHSIKFDASSLSSGVYYYQIFAGDFIQTKKMIFLK
jgi:hypothetical protein